MNKSELNLKKGDVISIPIMGYLAVVINDDPQIKILGDDDYSMVRDTLPQIVEVDNGMLQIQQQFELCKGLPITGCSPRFSPADISVLLNSPKSDFKASWTIGAPITWVLGCPIPLKNGGNDFFLVVTEDNDGLVWYYILSRRYGLVLVHGDDLPRIIEEAERLLLEKEYLPGQKIKDKERWAKENGIKLPVNPPIKNKP